MKLWRKWHLRDASLSLMRYGSTYQNQYLKTNWKKKVLRTKKVMGRSTRKRVQKQKVVKTNTIINTMLINRRIRISELQWMVRTCNSSNGSSLLHSSTSQLKWTHKLINSNITNQPSSRHRAPSSLNLNNQCSKLNSHCLSALYLHSLASRNKSCRKFVLEISMTKMLRLDAPLNFASNYRKPSEARLVRKWTYH